MGNYSSRNIPDRTRQRRHPRGSSSTSREVFRHQRAERVPNAEFRASHRRTGRDRQRRNFSDRAHSRRHVTHEANGATQRHRPTSQDAAQRNRQGSHRHPITTGRGHGRTGDIPHFCIWTGVPAVTGERPTPQSLPDGSTTLQVGRLQLRHGRIRRDDRRTR